MLLSVYDFYELLDALLTTAVQPEDWQHRQDSDRAKQGCASDYCRCALTRKAESSI